MQERERNMFNRATSSAAQPAQPHRLAMSMVLLLAMALLLGACNMMRGLGQDIGVAGETIEDTAEDVQN